MNFRRPRRGPCSSSRAASSVFSMYFRCIFGRDKSAHSMKCVAFQTTLRRPTRTRDGRDTRLGRTAFSRFSRGVGKRQISRGARSLSLTFVLVALSRHTHYCESVDLRLRSLLAWRVPTALSRARVLWLFQHTSLDRTLEPRRLSLTLFAEFAERPNFEIFANSLLRRWRARLTLFPTLFSIMSPPIVQVTLAAKCCASLLGCRARAA